MRLSAEPRQRASRRQTRAAPLPRSETTWGGGAPRDARVAGTPVGGGGCVEGRRSESAPTPNPAPQREDALGEGNTPSAWRETEYAERPA